MQLSPHDLIHLDVELSKRSLSEFTKMAWPQVEPETPLVWGWVLDGICEHLQAITTGKLNKNLCINVPPGTMKSLLTNVFWPAWEWTQFPHLRHIGTAHEETLAIRDTRKCRDLIKSDWYQTRWNVTLDPALDGKREFGNTSKGEMLARSFTKMTGRRGDRVRIDDPIAAFDANSDAHLEAAKIAFLETLPTRVNSVNSRVVVIMQRLAVSDTTGLILEKELDYEHFMVPMEFESDRKCRTSIGWEDPRTKDRELMFPERFPLSQVRELKKTLGTFAVAGQLQQRPTPRGGGIFKNEWWQIRAALPPIEYMVIYADTAQKTKELNDYSVFECWGKIRNGGPILIDVLRGRWEAPELLTMARAFWDKHRNSLVAPLRSMKVEDKVSGTGLIQTLRREGISVLPIQRSRDKISRAHDVAPSLEAGQVMVLGGQPWLADFLAEADAFPNGAHDDQLDPMMDAVSDMMGLTTVAPRVRAL